MWLVQNELERGRNRARRLVRRRVQYPRGSTVVRWKLNQGVVQPMWTDLVLLIAFLMLFFFFNIRLHVPCDFMGHIWLFSTVMGCVLWLIKMCPKYMVYFFRIWIEKNQFNSKSWFVCLSAENRGSWSPWVRTALRQLLTCVIISLSHLDIKADTVDRFPARNQLWHVGGAQ